MQKFDISTDTELQDVLKLFSAEPIGDIDVSADENKFYVTVGSRSCFFDFGGEI